MRRLSLAVLIISIMVSGSNYTLANGTTGSAESIKIVVDESNPIYYEPDVYKAKALPFRVEATMNDGTEKDISRENGVGIRFTFIRKLLYGAPRILEDKTGNKYLELTDKFQGEKIKIIATYGKISCSYTLDVMDQDEAQENTDYGYTICDNGFGSLDRLKFRFINNSELKVLLSSEKKIKVNTMDSVACWYPYPIIFERDHESITKSKQKLDAGVFLKNISKYYDNWVRVDTSKETYITVLPKTAETYSAKDVPGSTDLDKMRYLLLDKEATEITFDDLYKILTMPEKEDYDCVVTAARTEEGKIIIEEYENIYNQTLRNYLKYYFKGDLINIQLNENMNRTESYVVKVP